MKLTIIDNYDSFTFNLAHALKRLGAEVSVVRNDVVRPADTDAADALVLSPGPGIPSEAGQLTSVIHTYTGRKPMLGVCLGHQAIGEVFGASLQNLDSVYHGVQTPVSVTVRDPLFNGLPDRFDVGRYHSWVVSRERFPSETLDVLAQSDEGLIMALRHRTAPVWGIQFHPESVLTPLGETLLQNFLTAAAGR